MGVDNIKNNNEKTETEKTVDSIMNDLNTLTNDTEKDDKLELSGILTKEFAKGLEENKELVTKLQDQLNKINITSALEEKITDLSNFLSNIECKNIIEKGQKENQNIKEKNERIDTEIQKIKKEMEQEAELTFNNKTNIIYYNTDYANHIRNDFNQLLNEPDLPENIKNNLTILAGVEQGDYRGHIVHIGDVGAIQSFLLSNEQISQALQKEFNLSPTEINKKLGDGKFGKITGRGLEIYRDLIKEKLETIQQLKDTKEDIQERADIEEANSNIQKITDKYEVKAPELSPEAQNLLNKFPEELQTPKIQNDITLITNLTPENAHKSVDDIRVILNKFGVKAMKINDKINDLNQKDANYEANRTRLQNRLEKIVRKGLIENIKDSIVDIGNAKIGNLYKQNELFKKQTSDRQKQQTGEPRKTLYERKQAGIEITGSEETPEIKFTGELKKQLKDNDSEDTDD